MIKNWIIKFAFFLHESKRYKNIKQLFSDFLQNSDFAYKKYFDSFMILLILISIGILVYEVKYPVSVWIEFFDIYLVTFIFLVEYIGRVWVYNDWHTQVIHEYNKAEFLNTPFSLWSPTKKVLKVKLSYLVTPSAIIDLLAILPAYRPLRVLRIFVLFRVFKLLRYTKSIHQFVEVLATKRFELFTLLLLLLFIVVTAGIAIYVLEQKDNPNINTLFDAIYWALITMSTVGYGDISPVTVEGRVVSMLIIISGIAMISFVTSIIVSAFSEKLDELKEHRVIEDMNKHKAFMIICGYGQMTRIFLREHLPAHQKYVIIEEDKERVEEAIKEGYNVIHEDASRYGVLKRFNTEYTKITLLVLTGSDISNIYIILNAKSLSDNIKIIARANNEQVAKKCKIAGANHVILPNMVANKMLLTAINQPVMYRAIYAILTGQHLAQLDEMSVKDYPLLSGKKIEEIDFKKYKLLLIGFHSGKEQKFMFNPPATCCVDEEDVLLFMGREVSIEHFISMYKGKKYV